MDVDESRRDQAALGCERARRASADVAHFGNMCALDPDSAAKLAAAGAIDDHAIFDQQVEHCSDLSVGRSVLGDRGHNLALEDLEWLDLLDIRQTENHVIDAQAGERFALRNDVFGAHLARREVSDGEDGFFN
jgi:hypothetical protein